MLAREFACIFVQAELFQTYQLFAKKVGWYVAFVCGAIFGIVRLDSQWRYIWQCPT
jgi:hypothetical protein